jgi:hypothetical protein
MWSRPPVEVILREGWNSLVIKLPVGRFSSAETRLVKWMFTAMIVTTDGKSQPAGLVYSPERAFCGKGTAIPSSSVSSAGCGSIRLSEPLTDIHVNDFQINSPGN